MTAVVDGPGLARIGQIALTVSDLPKAIAFYRDALGLRFLVEAPPSLAFFDCAGIRLMLTPPEREGAVAGQRFNSILYFSVEDIQSAAAGLQARGVVFDQPPHVVARLPHAHIWMAFFHDTDGNMLAIMSEAAPA